MWLACPQIIRRETIGKKVVNMEISGKIIALLPERSGQSAKGPWRKQEYILETDSQYPKKICFMAWGEKIDQFNIEEGESVEVSVDLESREYNGRWYTDVKAWQISRHSANSNSSRSIDSKDYSDPQKRNLDSIDIEDIPF